MNRLQTIRAESMAAALAEVKVRLGDDAVILHTRSERRKGLRGLASREVVEVTAARSISDLPGTLQAAKVQPRQDVRTESDRANGVAPAMVAALPATASDQPRLADEMHELKGLVQDLVRRQRATVTHGPAVGSESPEALYDAYISLVENDVARETADALVAEVRGELTATDLTDPRQVREALARKIERMLPEGGPIDLAPGSGPKVVTLVGPTGVGKTTTIAKLAADFRLRQNASVGLITIDTYRIAAVEQLRTYAEIIGTPLHVVDSPDAMRAALDDLQDCDVILVDTAGSSPRDELRIGALKSVLAEIAGGEVHLVLATTARTAVLDEALLRFKPLDYRHVIFTKLDEAIGCGVILNCMQHAKAQLSYVTTGQNVPNDFRIMKRAPLARSMVGSTGGAR